MNDLWTEERDAKRRSVEPLAARMRPRTLDAFAGQQHIVGEGMLLRRILAAEALTSLIFWGPPGTGKTTLAEVIANHTGRHFERANAAGVGVKEIRTILADAARRIETGGKRTILFLDEIHRFARNQQDVLLADVERGIITLIGATTDNPYFAINSALVSRSTLFQFEALTEADIVDVIERARTDPRGFGDSQIVIDDDAAAHWARVCDGDARRALNALEVAVLSSTPEIAGDVGESQRSGATELTDVHGDAPSPPAPLPGGEGRLIHIDLESAQQSIQHKALVYDGTGDEHYDVISAFIKSMRGSDPDAAVYWLARMLEAGEDPRFIARRIAIFASEDIGNAAPQAISIASAAYQLTERIGMPECQLTLAQAAIYMACAAKSKASANAIWAARSEVRDGRTVPVPRHLRDAHYSGAKSLGHGQNYIDPHKRPDDAADQEYLGVDRVFYEPVDLGVEAAFKRLLDESRRDDRSAATNQPTDVAAGRTRGV